MGVGVNDPFEQEQVDGSGGSNADCPGDAVMQLHVFDQQVIKQGCQCRDRGIKKISTPEAGPIRRAIDICKPVMQRMLPWYRDHDRD